METSKDIVIREKQELMEVLKKCSAIIERTQNELEEIKPDADMWRAFVGSKEFIDARAAATALTERTGYNVGSNKTLYRFMRAVGMMPQGETYVYSKYNGKRFKNCKSIQNGKAHTSVHFSGSGIKDLAEKIIENPQGLKKFTSLQLKNRGLIE